KERRNRSRADLELHVSAHSLETWVGEGRAVNAALKANESDGRAEGGAGQGAAGGGGSVGRGGEEGPKTMSAGPGGRVGVDGGRLNGVGTGEMA
ncbi:hypothetical protein B1218_37135, partial [Pseudomonas ogarae]